MPLATCAWKKPPIMKKLALLLLLYSATAAGAGIGYWHTPVGDGGTIAAVQEALRQARKDRELEPTGRLDRRTAAALGVDVDGSS